MLNQISMKEYSKEAKNQNSSLQKRDIQNRQQRNTMDSAVRVVFNSTPATKQIAMSIGIPNALHYNPFNAELDPPNFGYSDHLICNNCGSYLNIHCELYETKKRWICCICRKQNTLTQDLSKQLINSETYEITSYLTQQVTPIRKQKIYLFVIDLCISNKDMNAIKRSLLSFIKAKQQQNYQNVNIVNLFGLVTYSKFVYCYELSSKLNTVVCIHPQNEYTSENLQKLLNLKSQQTNQAVQKYFVNIKTEKQKLIKRIKNLKAEQNIYKNNDPQLRCRAKRAFGQALNVAFSLSQFLPNNCRIVNLIGGPCTYGVGRTISTDFKQQMRSITDYQKGDNVEFYEKSSLFYNSLKQKATGKRSPIDMFIFSVEETGLKQMYQLFRVCGGLLVLGQQFDEEHKIFENSFKKAYIQDEDNQMASSLTNGCITTLTCSKDILFNGAFGCCKSLQVTKGKQYASEKIIGYGETNSWFISSMDCYKTITFVYELSSTKAQYPVYYIQLRTAYQDYWGFHKTRVTTIMRQWQTNKTNIIDNFDQQAAIVALARWYAYRIQSQLKLTSRQWIDKILVKWTHYFSNFIKGDPQSFSLPQNVKFFPQFVYHFRRNAVFRKSGLSLDQLTYHLHQLNSETVEHCLTIIQPALLSYTIQKPYPSPVRLEEQEMKNSVILLLDTYFNLLLWYGENIEYWEKQQYHKQKQYQHVKSLLQAPLQDIKYLLNNRFPSPGFYKTNTGHSKERILKSKVSPSASQLHNQNTLTDDKSFHTFMKALVQIIVNGRAL